MVSLVTGGAGFIGRHIVRLLCQRGEQVRVLDVADAIGLPGGVELVQGSVTDPQRVARAMRGVRAVYHVAGNPQLWDRDKQSFYTLNFGGTRTVLEAAASAGVERVIHTSSMTTLIGRHSPRRPSTVDEGTWPSPDDMLGDYCRSKLLAEQAALAWAARGLPVIVVIPTIPIGPGDINLTPPSRMILDFANGRSPAFLESVMNVIDVRDLAAGQVAARERGRIGERYILGGSNLPLSRLLAILQDVTGIAMPARRVPYLPALIAATLAELIADNVTGRPPIAPLAGVRLAGRPVSFDTSKAMRELGLPQRPIREAFEDAVAWFRQESLITDSAGREAVKHLSRA